MDASNIVAHELESYGVRTFSAKEMAFNILGLMHPLLFSITQVEPIWADLNGGMDRLPDLADITTRIRLSLNKKSELRRAIARDNSADFKIINSLEAERVLQTVNVTPRAKFCFDFPALGSSESLADVTKLQGMMDLDKIIVITGFAEVGPWGSSRTRWEMEARGQFTMRALVVERLTHVLFLPLNCTDFRHVQKPTICDARMTEQLERKQRVDQERRVKRKLVERLRGCSVTMLWTTVI
jgi:fatty acid synthase subunit beta